MDNIWNEIKKVADANNGYIKTSEVEALSISRPMIRKYVDAGKLERIRKGLYILSDDLADEYASIQLQSSKAIFSFGTALYFWGLSDRTPHYIDITLPQGTNITRLKRDTPNLRCHYVKKEMYDLGITELKSPQGAVIRLYDKERCICDLIRNKDKTDMQLYTQAIKDYFNSKADRRKLLKYSKLFGVEDKVRTYMEVM